LVAWIFFIFQPNKIRVSPTDLVSSLFPLRCRLSSGRRHYVTALCHASFLLSQDEIAASASSSGNALFRRLPSQTEIEALNSHHRRGLPSLNRQTLTLYCYKKIISTLTTLSTTQSRLHFASSLTKTPHHRSSTHRLRSLSLLSHAHHLSAQ
jgi:hypothetical protein